MLDGTGIRRGDPRGFQYLADHPIIVKNPIKSFIMGGGPSILALLTSVLFMGTNGAYPEEYSETQSSTESITRERLPLNEGWRFKKYESTAEADDLIYDLRPNSDTPVYTDRTGLEGDAPVLKPWILPNQDEPGEILLTATGEYLRGQSVVISSHEK